MYKNKKSSQPNNKNNLNKEVNKINNKNELQPANKPKENINSKSKDNIKKRR